MKERGAPESFMYWRLSDISTERSTGLISREESEMKRFSKNTQDLLSLAIALICLSVAVSLTVF